MTHIDIITNYEDVQSFLHTFLSNISVGDFGHENKRLKSLPKLYADIQKWESANISYLQDGEKEVFYSQKQSIEKVIEEYKIQTEVNI